MDPSPIRFETAEPLRAPPSLAVLLAATAARQAASATARATAPACPARAPLAPGFAAGGAFNARAARALIAWQDT